MEAIKTSVTISPAESEVKGKAVKKSGRRIGYNYIILKSLKESQKNDVVKCLYIKSLTNFGICVVKEGTYGDSKDKQGRDIKDRLMWQKQLHESLQDKVRLPRLLGSFEENGNYYLVLERIKGKSLYKACREAGKDLREGLITGNRLGMKFLDYMVQMIELLETLHKHGIVHRDVTATNFMITPAGKVTVIDMELSYSLERQFPSPPFQLGTHGYMSPEQEATLQPSVEQDTFSAAAIILLMWTGISPVKLTNIPFAQLGRMIYFIIPDKLFAENLILSLHPEPALRPALAVLGKTIVNYSNDKRMKVNRPLSNRIYFTREDMLNTVQQTIHTLASPLLADQDKGWFSENNNAPQNIDKKKINKGFYAGFYKGSAGVIYLLSKARMIGLEIENTRPFIETGIEIINRRYISRLDAVNPGLHFGCAGIAAVLATSIREGLIEPQTEYFGWINRLLDKENVGIELQHGIAGQGLANLVCLPFLHSQKVDERLHSYVDRILAGQQSDGSWIRAVRNKKVRITKGFAHGVAGIIYFLLEYAQRYNKPEVMRSAELGLQWLMKKSVRDKNAIQWQSSTNKEIAPWWCEGAAGIALTFIKAFSITGDKKYHMFAAGALFNHSKQIVDNNLSQCHGLSGLGEIYLEAYRVFKEQEWLDRAEWIVQLLMHINKQHPTHGPYWLIEGERQPVSNFMTGVSGVVHFILRFSYHDKVDYPLLP